MTNVTPIAAVVCVLLSLLLAWQCFTIAIRMTATARAGLRILVGVIAFGVVVVPSIVLGGVVEAYWVAIGVQAAEAALLWVILRKWKRGMPAEYDTSPAPLQREINS